MVKEIVIEEAEKYEMGEAVERCVAAGRHRGWRSAGDVRGRAKVDGLERAKLDSLMVGKVVMGSVFD